MTLTSDAKFIIGILITTVLVIGGGTYITSTKSTSSTGKVIPESLMERLVREDSPFLGATDATVTVVEFGDFQCPACGALHPALKEVKKQYADKRVRFVYRQFPLSQHENAMPASLASLAAHKQGKFWEYHDLLFEHQANLAAEDLTAYATQLGLNMETFTADSNSTEIKDAVQRDIADGRVLGVNSTPTIYINDTQYTGKYTLKDMSAAIDAQLGTP